MTTITSIVGLGLGLTLMLMAVMAMRGAEEPKTEIGTAWSSAPSETSYEAWCADRVSCYEEVVP